MSIHQIDNVPNIQVHYSEESACIGARGGNIIESTDHGRTWETLGTVPTNLANLFYLRFSLYRRLTRRGICNVYPLGRMRFLFVGNHQICLLNKKTQRARPVHTLRGRRLLRSSVCVTPEHGVYYGEYWSNRRREPVHIYHSEDGDRWEILHTFSENQIRHVHAIEFDPFTHKLWIATGDEDREAAILISDWSLSEIEVVGSGNQKWRTSSLLFTEDAVYWGSDDPDGINHIWKYERDSKATSRIAEVTGPVYYGKVVGNRLFFATTAEYGTGNQDGYVHLYGFDLEGDCHELMKWEKDSLHPCWFGYGVIEFAGGHVAEDQFWITTKSTRGGLKSILLGVE